MGKPSTTNFSNHTTTQLINTLFTKSTYPTPQTRKPEKES